MLLVQVESQPVDDLLVGHVGKRNIWVPGCVIQILHLVIHIVLFCNNSFESVVPYHLRHHSIFLWPFVFLHTVALSVNIRVGWLSRYCFFQGNNIIVSSDAICNFIRIVYEIRLSKDIFNQFFFCVVWTASVSTPKLY